MPTITVGNYLLTRLKELGVDTIFGVPGDYNMEFLDQIEDFRPGMKWGNNCNELNAGYAADGYSRVKNLGAIVTTFGVGELSAMNAIAGSFSEMVPVVHIVGTPSTSSQAQGAMLHHTLGNGDFRVFHKMFSEITTAQTNLTQKNAAEEIDRVLRECVLRIRPVYIGIPTDVAFKEINVENLPLKPLDLSASLNPPKAHKAAIKAILSAIEKARHPIILVDACALRHKVSEQCVQLMEQTGFPTYVSLMGKGAIPEDHSNFRGVYAGEASDDRVKHEVNQADLILSIGSILCDLNTGGFTYHVPGEKLIELHSYETKVLYATYERVGMRELLPDLVKSLTGKHRNYILGPIRDEVPKPSPPSHIEHSYFWPLLAKYIPPKSIVVAETGTAEFGIMGMKAPKDSIFITQVLWGSIGYSVGAALGAAIAGEKEGRRTYLLVGDGSFQLTGQEVSTMIRSGVKPVIILINNDGYTIEKLIHGSNRSYNKIQMWRYADTLSYFNADPSTVGVARKLSKCAELEEALNRARNQKDKIHFLEVVMRDMDAPPSLVKQTKATSKLNSYGELEE